jgi:UDP-glucose 4-epimerase
VNGLNSKKKCLVLGANGFLGRELCVQLYEEGRSVIGYDIAAENPFAKNHGIEYVQGDFVHAEKFDDLLAGVDTVYHLISTTLPCEGTDAVMDEICDNVLPTVRLLDSMVRLQVFPQIIFASSGGTVYGDTVKQFRKTSDMLEPISSYGLQKKIIESCIEFYGRVHGLPYKIARMANVYGLGQNTDRKQGIIPIFVYAIRAGKPITLFGDTDRDYIYMKDAIRALILMNHYEGEAKIFHIATGMSHSLRMVAELIGRMLGKEIVIEERPIRSFDVKSTSFDVSETECALGWRAEVSLACGIQKVIDSLD